MFKYGIVVIVVLLAVVAFIFFFNNNSSQTVSLLDRAVELEKQGDTAEALQLYKDIAASGHSDSDLARAKVRMARIEVIGLIKSGSYDAASARIAEILSQYGDCKDIAWFAYSTAGAYSSMGRYEDAIALYDNAAEKKAGTGLGASAAVKSSYLKTLSFIHNGDFDQADRLLEDALVNYPDCKDLKWYLFSAASEYDQLTERDRAKKYYDLYVSRFGLDRFGTKAKVKSSRIEVLSLINSGSFEDADKEINRIAEKYRGQKDMDWYLLSVASEYDMIKQPGKARRYYNDYIERFPGSTGAAAAKIKLARLDALDAVRSNDIDGAAGGLELVLQDAERLPENVKWYLYHVGCSLDEKGAVEQANKFYDAFLAEFPTDDLATGVRLRKRVLDASGDDEINSVVTDIEALLQDPGRADQLDWCIYSCACRLDTRGCDQQAGQLYKRLIEVLPESELAAGARIKSSRIDVVDIVKTASLQEADTAVEKFKQQFSTSEDYTDAMFFIAEAYHESTAKVPAESRQQYLEKSIEILENEIVPNITDVPDKAWASYVIGLDSYGLGQYGKAADAFMQTTEVYPEHEYADYCIFTAGRCYEKMLQENSITKQQAEPVIKAAYSKLLAEFPESQYSTIAAERMKKYQGSEPGI